MQRNARIAARLCAFPCRIVHTHRGPVGGVVDAADVQHEFETHRGTGLRHTLQQDVPCRGASRGGADHDIRSRLPTVGPESRIVAIDDHIRIGTVDPVEVNDGMIRCRGIRTRADEEPERINLAGGDLIHREVEHQATERGIVNQVRLVQMCHRGCVIEIKGLPGCDLAALQQHAVAVQVGQQEVVATGSRRTGGLEAKVHRHVPV